MPRISRRVSFQNRNGVTLAGIVEVPQREIHAWAIFSHCFTCTKDLKSIVRISRHLADLGIGVLRFDFTGLGDSHGDFSESTIHDNIADVQSAADFLLCDYSAPAILIGHSLGGAAMIAAGNQISSARCVVNIASPAHTRHLAKILRGQSPEIAEQGLGQVTIGGRTYSIREPMVAALEAWDHGLAIERLNLPLLIMFSPADETLPFQHGLDMFQRATSPVSFINLDGADHLFTNRPADILFVGDLINVWARRYI